MRLVLRSARARFMQQHRPSLVGVFIVRSEHSHRYRSTHDVTVRERWQDMRHCAGASCAEETPDVNKSCYEGDDDTER